MQSMQKLWFDIINTFLSVFNTYTADTYKSGLVWDKDNTFLL